MSEDNTTKYLFSTIGVVAGAMAVSYLISKITTSDQIQPNTWKKVKQKERKNSLRKWGGEIPEQLKEIYQLLKYPEIYTQYNADLPKGILLYGLPGTGKTHFARTLSQLTNSSFFFISASAFDEIYVGQGAQRVRNLFAEARASIRPRRGLYDSIWGSEQPVYQNAIIFIDEIDSLGNRDSMNNNTSYSTLSELLTCMDGLGQSKNIFVIGATNKLHTVDPALRRSGRFDRVCKIDLPSSKSRRSLIHFFLRDKLGFAENIESDEEFMDYLVGETKGFSVADLKNFANEAVLSAIKDSINLNDGKGTPKLIDQDHVTQALLLLKEKLSTENKKKIFFNVVD